MQLLLPLLVPLLEPEVVPVPALVPEPVLVLPLPPCGATHLPLVMAKSGLLLQRGGKKRSVDLQYAD